MNNKAVLFGIDYSSSYNLLNDYKSHTTEVYTMKHFLENKLNNASAKPYKILKPQKNYRKQQ